MKPLEIREFAPRPTRDEIDRQVQCDGKFQHASQQDAQRAIRRRGRTARCNPYRCKFCRCWHVGSSVIPRKQRWPER